MSEQTKIEWTDRTWNPWEGCTKVSPGCAHCYAEARNRRFSKGANWGKGKPRRRTSEENWKKPLKWNRDDQTLRQLHLSGPFPRLRVFPSLCDIFDDEVPVAWLADYFRLIRDTPNLDHLILTKRPENFFTRLAPIWDGIGAQREREWVCRWHHGEAPPNVWVGVSVEDQQRADERIPELLKIPAKVRFLSVEPLLSRITLRHLLGFKNADASQVHWVIIGGESGPGTRPCNVEWIRDLVSQCKTAGVPVFVKQFSGPRPGMQGMIPDDIWTLKQFPNAGSV